MEDAADDGGVEGELKVFPCHQLVAEGDGFPWGEVFAFSDSAEVRFGGVAGLACFVIDDAEGSGGFVLFDQVDAAPDSEATDFDGIGSVLEGWEVGFHEEGAPACRALSGVESGEGGEAAPGGFQLDAERDGEVGTVLPVEDRGDCGVEEVIDFALVRGRGEGGFAVQLFDGGVDGIAEAAGVEFDGLGVERLHAEGVFEVEAEWAGEVIGELGDTDFLEDGIPLSGGRDAEFPWSLPCGAGAVPFLFGRFVEEEGDAGREFGGRAAEEETAGSEGVVAGAAAAAEEREAAGAAAAGEHGGEEE